MQISRSGKHRLDAIDMARGFALVAMAVYHFAWDLEFFGYSEPGTVQSLPWRLFARLIASSFLFLAGVSLVLAHGQKLRARSFLVRFAKLAAAAALITVASYQFSPGNFIFFGILHAIAVFSVIGLLFRNLNGWVLLTLAAVSIALPYLIRSEVFDQPVLWWIGLSPFPPVSNDYVPLFPWIGPFLIGMAVARIKNPSEVASINAVRASGLVGRTFSLTGRHSLKIYLVHQPVLIASIWLFSQVAPANTETAESRFMTGCHAECTASQNDQYCTRFCICVLEELDDSGTLSDVLSRQVTDEVRLTVRRLSHQCAQFMDMNRNE